MRTIVWTPAADRDLDRLSVDVRNRVTTAVERLALTGEGDVRALTALPGSYRLRVGAWRVIFRQGADTILVDRILPRGRAYRDWKRQPPCCGRRAARRAADEIGSLPSLTSGFSEPSYPASHQPVRPAGGQER